MCSEEQKKCERPQELKGQPQDCSPGQVRKCHGDQPDHLCVESGCENPDQLEGKPEACSDEQIRECHGDENDHPCVSAGK